MKQKKPVLRKRGRRPVTTEQDKKKIRKLYRSGIVTETIAYYMGLSIVTIYNVLRETNEVGQRYAKK